MTAARCLQAAARRFIVSASARRRILLNLRLEGLTAARRLQAAARRFIARRFMQAAARRFIASASARRRMLLNLQRFARGFLGRGLLHRSRRAAVCLQSAFRRRLSSAAFARALSRRSTSFTCPGSIANRLLTRFRTHEGESTVCTAARLSSAVFIIQRTFRGQLDHRPRPSLQRPTSSHWPGTTSSLYPGSASMLRFICSFRAYAGEPPTRIAARLDVAARTVQRGFTAYRVLQLECSLLQRLHLAAAVRIQARIRGHLIRNKREGPLREHDRYSVKHVTQIQAFARRRLARQLVHQLHLALKHITSYTDDSAGPPVQLRVHRSGRAYVHQLSSTTLPSSPSRSDGAVQQRTEELMLADSSSPPSEPAVFLVGGGLSLIHI